MASPTLNLEKLRPAPSLKEMALATIKEAILAQRLVPGVMYTEAALTAEMGISRTPVREALLHLASRGLVAYFPRKGFKIRFLAEKDIADLFELRLALEMAVIRHITPRLTEEALAEIDRVRSRYRVVAQQGDPVESTQANMAFHACLAALTNNPYLIRALEEIGDLINIASVRSLEADFRTREAIGEHDRIVARLKARSLTGALRAMEAHLRTTQARVLARSRPAGGE